MSEATTLTRYRKVIKKSILIDSTELVIDTLPSIELTAPITGFIDGQNGSELYSIPGVYPDCQYGISYVKETGEIKLYASATSISEKNITLVVYFTKNEES